MDILIAIATGLISLFFLILGYRNLDVANNWAKLTQAIVSVTAFGLAAYWYFVERKGMPHVEVSQTVMAHALGDDTIAVEAHVAIKNIGERQVVIQEIQSHLQDVEAGTYDYVALARLPDAEYWRARRPGANGNQFNGSELRWPVVRVFDERVRHEIEAGETDLVVVTFLFRCAEVRGHVRVATDILNPASGTRRLAWKARNFLDLGTVCPQQQRRLR